MSPTRARALRSLGRRFRAVSALAFATALPVAAQGPAIRVVSEQAGSRLQVDGRDFMVLGMNWDYFPIGTNYAYDFWSQPHEFIRTALDREMGLLRGMGVNAIRVYAGIPPRWVRYIYEKHGIFTVLNHSMGRDGVTVGGVFRANTDYSDPRVRQLLVAYACLLWNSYRVTD